VAHENRELGLNGRHKRRIDLSLGVGLNRCKVES
jgi:hypothetical protein